MQLGFVHEFTGEERGIVSLFGSMDLISRSIKCVVWMRGGALTDGTD